MNFYLRLQFLMDFEIECRRSLVEKFSDLGLKIKLFIVYFFFCFCSYAPQK